MNGEELSSSTTAAPANTNDGEESAVIREGKGLRYRNLQAFGRPEVGLHAWVLPGDSIVIHGVNFNRAGGPVRIDRTFALGDVATYGGRNLTYTGTIVSIGEKTVTVRDGSTVRRLTIGEFSRLNKDFSAERAARHNASWRD